MSGNLLFSIYIPIAKIVFFVHAYTLGGLWSFGVLVMGFSGIKFIKNHTSCY